MMNRLSSAWSSADRAPRVSFGPTLPMDIQSLRDQIDALDREIVARLNQRAELARQIGIRKAEQQLQTFAPGREQEVLAQVTAANSGPLPDRALQSIYCEIVSACRALEKPLTIAYWGPP